VGAKIELDNLGGLITVTVTYEPITEEELATGRVDWPKWLMREAQKKLKEWRRGKSSTPQADG
jgi:hypothetical protein